MKDKGFSHKNQPFGHLQKTDYLPTVTIAFYGALGSFLESSNFPRPSTFNPGRVQAWDFIWEKLGPGEWLKKPEIHQVIRNGLFLSYP